MRHLIAVPMATFAITVQAFRGTSPFLMFSSRPFPDHMRETPKGQLQSSMDVLEMATQFLSSCNSEKYYIISQPELSATGLSKSLPHLGEALNHESVKSSFVVSEVIGLEKEDRHILVKLLTEKCKAKVTQEFVDNGRNGARSASTGADEPMLGGWTESEAALGETDPALQYNVLQDIRKFYNYTFILLSTPLTEIEDKDNDPIYEAAFNDPVHMDLKRNLNARKGNSTKSFDTRPLFEKYQFLTPGLFMGLLVGLILISILSVGLRAISSLEVSYAAFDKEMGPAAQKKQQ